LVAERSAIGPGDRERANTVGVHVAFWGDDELLNVFTTGESPTAAEPEGVPVIVR